MSRRDMPSKGRQLDERTRKRTYRDHINFYCRYFGFPEHQRVLITGDFLARALQCKIDLRDALPALLSGTALVHLSHCSLHHIEARGDDALEELIAARRFAKWTCHHKEPLSERECIKQCLGSDNKHKMWVGTMSSATRLQLEKIPGIPFVFINSRDIMVIGRRSKSSEDAVHQRSLAPSKALNQELALLRRLMPDVKPVPSSSSKDGSKPVSAPSVALKDKATTNRKSAPETRPDGAPVNKSQPQPEPSTKSAVKRPHSPTPNMTSTPSVPENAEGLSTTDPAPSTSATEPTKPNPAKKRRNRNAKKKAVVPPTESPPSS